MKSIGLFVLLLSTTAFSQNPGNVGTANLTAWFKPDALTLGNVTSWTTTFPVAGITLTESGGVYPTAVNTPANATSNYNTTVDFTGNASGASMKLLENNSTFDLLDNNSSGDQGTFLCVYYLPAAQTGAGHMVTYRESSASSTDGIQLRTSLGGATGRIALGSSSNSTNASSDWAEEFRPSIIGYQGNRFGSTTMTSFKRSKVFTGGIASGTTGNAGLRFGAQYTGGTTYPGLYQGFLSEVVFYNRDLTAVELSKVNTYLGIKYAITLDNTGGGTQGDYVGTNGTTIWDADVNTAYHNDVIGIGRDDNEALLQKQSHAFDDITRVYLATLQTTNVANSGSFSANSSYLVLGHNQGNMCATLASNAEIPGSCGLYSRLEREWKVTKTNFAQNCSMDFKLNACAQPGSVNVNHLRLLVDNDGNFGNGGTTCYYNGDGSGITITYTNPTITISGISAAHLPNNATNYITIASIQSITPLPLDLISFDATKITNRQVDLSWETASEKNVDYFEIERSNNGMDWSLVGQITATGSENEEENYLLTDFQPIHPMTYYRLTEIDDNGVSQFKGIRMVQFDETALDELHLYPNPTNNSLHLESSSEVDFDEMHLISSVGQICNLIFEQTSDSSGILYLEQLPAGIYLLQVNGKVHKIIKN